MAQDNNLESSVSQLQIWLYIKPIAIRCQPYSMPHPALHLKGHGLGHKTCPSCLGHSRLPVGLLGRGGEASTSSKGSPFSKLSNGAHFCRQNHREPRTASALQASCTNAHAHPIFSSRQQQDCFKQNHHYPILPVSFCPITSFFCHHKLP